jgi:hypothetical protein
MLIITMTLKRTSPDVPFFPNYPGWQQTWDNLINEQVIAGILTRPNNFRVESEDGLELKVVTHWRSVTDNFSFLGRTDVSEAMEQRDLYFTTNGVIAEFHREIVQDEYDQE